MNGCYQETAGRYQQTAAVCIDVALSHSDVAERAPLLRTAGLWLALAALARKLVIPPVG
jgi:hypothetical protein